MYSLRAFVVQLLLVYALSLSASAAENGGLMSPNQLRRAGYQPLIESNSMDAWELKPWHKGHWTIGDGVIDYDGKAEKPNFENNDLWTKKPTATSNCTANGGSLRSRR